MKGWAHKHILLHGNSILSFLCRMICSSPYIEMMIMFSHTIVIVFRPAEFWWH